MALSKIKSKKQAARLKSRQMAWENISSTIKFSKSGKPAFTRPGSNKK